MTHRETVNPLRGLRFLAVGLGAMPLAGCLGLTDEGVTRNAPFAALTAPDVSSRPIGLAPLGSAQVGAGQVGSAQVGSAQVAVLPILPAPTGS